MQQITATQKISFLKKMEWSETLFFLLIAGIFIIINLPSVNTILYEQADIAANGLLIQDAKSLHLLVGNYSRLGFNHPGPAILYVLAFGELIFYDWLHLVNSPIAGQTIAAAFYNTFWIALIFKQIRQITGSMISSVLTISVFLLVTTFLDKEILTSLWFPYLYFFPFAAFLVSISRLVYGKTESLFTVFLSAGFLINGHVCFVPLIGIIFFIITIFNYCISRKNSTCIRILSKNFLYINKKSIIGCFIILILFFMPLLLQTILHFPGPVPDYIAFSRQPKTNTLWEIFQYVSFYWKGKVFFLMGISVGLAMYFFSRSLFKKSVTDVRSILITFFAATFSALFYAKYGIDNLNMSYIEVFYGTVPALLVALMCLCIYQMLNIPQKREWVSVLAVLCLIFLFTRIYHPYKASFPVGEQHTTSQLDMTEFIHSLEIIKSKSKKRLVLDLDVLELGDNQDRARDWDKVWGNLVGIQLYAKRNKIDNLFCINKNWHILFTKSALCSNEEVLTGKRFIVVSNSDKNPIGLPVIKGMGLEFYEYSPFDISQGKYISVSDAPFLFEEYFLQRGWSDVEKNFVWSEGNESHLLFRLKPGFSGTVLLDASAFVPFPDSKKLLSVYVNNTFASNYEFTPENNRKKLTISVKNLKSEIIDIKLVIDKVVSPHDLGLSPDPRKVGIALYGIQVK